ncbi:UNVERIFIED_CONTAM: hypothetical protein JM85_2284 [Acetobacter peroxydans]
MKPIDRTGGSRFFLERMQAKSAGGNWTKVTAKFIRSGILGFALRQTTGFLESLVGRSLSRQRRHQYTSTRSSCRQPRFDRRPRGSTVCSKKRHRSHEPHSPRFSRSWQCSGPTMITCLPRRKAQKRLARHFILVTSAGAGGSAIYLQTKGKIEQAVIGFGFEPVDLICPGFLIGSFNDRPALRRATTGAPQPSSPPLHSLPLSFSG